MHLGRLGTGGRPWRAVAHARRGFTSTLCALLLAWLAVGFVPGAAWATTEDFAATPAAPLSTVGTNPAVVSPLVYTYRDASRAETSNILWASDGGRGLTAGLITAYDYSTAGCELTITRSGGGTFNFQSIDLANYTGTPTIYFEGYYNNTQVYTGTSVTLSNAANYWTTVSTGSAWTGVDEVRIHTGYASGDTFDPFVDNVVYDLTSATTGSAGSITRTTATLNGTVNAAGTSTVVTFSYGTTTAYGSSATAAQSPVTGSSNTAVSAALTGLSCGTTYHYRVTAAGSMTVNGADATFSTSACNVVPSFVGSTTTLALLKDASATDIKSLLHASDSDSGQTLTWSQSAAPSHGTLAISSATASSGSTDITPGGTITYTPTSGYVGTDSFTVQVSDGSDTSTRTISVAVKNSQTISFVNPGTQNFGTTPTLAATATSGLAVSFSSSTTGVCTTTSGGALTFLASGTCIISADQAGDSAYAAATQVSQSFEVAAVVPGAPTGVAGTAGDQQVSVAFTAPSFTGGASISGYTVTSSPGSKTGTGSASPIVVTGLTNGTAYTFTVTATNSVGVGAVSSASASVTPKTSQTISFANPGTQVFGTTPTLSATASSGLAVSFSSSTAAVCTVSGSALSFVSTGTCTISADQAGDGTYLAATTVSRSFTVSGPTIAITPTSLPSGTINTAYSQTLSASGSTPSYTFAVTSGSLPTGLTLSSAGLLSGTPTAQGSFSFTVTATDSSASHYTGSQAYTLVVSPQVPVANAVSATVAYNSTNNAISLNVTGGAATSVAVAGAASHGTATASGTSITYTPASGYSGADSFTYTATNSGGTSAAATVSITVTAQVPVAGAVSVSVLANSTNNAISLNVTGGTATSVAVAGAASHGTATASGTSITYTPATGYTGADSFTYTATNSGGTSAAATVSITVNARANPAQDATVQGVVNSQATTAGRFAKAQISNFQTHLESLHTRPAGGAGFGQQGTGTGTQLSTRKSARTTAAATGLASDASGSAAAAVDASVGASGSQGAAAGKWDLSSILLKLAQNAKSGSKLWPWKSLNLDSKSEDPMGLGMSVWTGGTLSIGHSSGSDTRFTTSGISMGTDFRVSEALVLGLGVGYGRQHERIGTDGSESKGNSYGLLFYGSLLPLDGFFMDGLIGLNRLSFDAQRYVSGAGTLAQSQRTGTQWIGSLSGGYEFKTEAVLLSPYLRFDVASTRLNRADESGAGAYNLVYFEQDMLSTKAAMGLRGTYVYTRENFTARPFARLEYQRDFSNSGVATIAYADQLSSGANYQYNLGVTDKNSLVLGGGADVLLFESWQLAMEYRFTRGSDTQMQTFSALLRKFLTF